MESSVQTVLDIGSDEFYRAMRYQIPLSVLLINSTNKSIFDTLENSIRATDIIQQISSELFVVFLTHTDLKNANAFMENLKEEVEFSATVDEYKGFKDEFILNLFLKNQELIKAL
jgi:hypothetical protein